MSYYNFSYDKYKTPKSKSKTENIANNDGKKLYLPHIYLDKQTNVVKDERIVNYKGFSEEKEKIILEKNSDDEKLILNETNDKYFIKHYKVIFEIIF